MNEPRDFKTELHEFLLRNDKHEQGLLRVSDTPASLIMLGMQQLPICITKEHVRRITHPKVKDNPHFHGITEEQLGRIPELISTPALVMDALDISAQYSSSRKVDSLVLLLPEVDKDNFPLITVIKPNGTFGYEFDLKKAPQLINHMKSVYGKSNLENFLDRAYQQDKILFIDSKMLGKIATSIGLQLSPGLSKLPIDTLIRQSQVIKSSQVGNKKQSQQKTPRQGLLQQIGDQCLSASEHALQSPTHKARRTK